MQASASESPPSIPTPIRLQFKQPHRSKPGSSTPTTGSLSRKCRINQAERTTLSPDATRVAVPRKPSERSTGAGIYSSSFVEPVVRIDTKRRQGKRRPFSKTLVKRATARAKSARHSPFEPLERGMMTVRKTETPNSADLEILADSIVRSGTGGDQTEGASSADTVFHRLNSSESTLRGETSRKSTRGFSSPGIVIRRIAIHTPKEHIITSGPKVERVLTKELLENPPGSGPNPRRFITTSSGAQLIESPEFPPTVHSSPCPSSRIEAVPATRGTETLRRTAMSQHVLQPERSLSPEMRSRP